MLDTIQLLLAQLSIDYVVSLVMTAAQLMALNGFILGVIGWSITDKYNNSLFMLFLGAGIGVIVGLLVEGGQILLEFGTLEGIYNNMGTLSGQFFISLVAVLRWTLGGMAVGGLVSSFRQAIMGGLIGIMAGTVAGVIVILLQQEFGLMLNDALLTMGGLVLTLGLLAVMGYGQGRRG
jgi:hypothetical protein